MEREFAALRAPLSEVIDFLIETARVRPGFREFVAAYDPLIVSSSFHETITPVLNREGIVARLRANHAEPSPNGWRIAWTSDTDCNVCGEPCKRGGLPNRTVIYVGDGYSDRCAALAASRIFTCGSLAAYLATRSVAYEPFTDFHALLAELSG